MARRPELEAFAAEHGLKMVTVADLIRYRRRTERLVERDRDGHAAHALRRVHRATATARCVDGRTHVALVVGRRRGQGGRARARALRVPDRRRLPLAALRLRRAARRGDAARRRPRAEGVVLYIVGHEGRGIGLAQQAQGLRAAGAGRRHGRGQRGARLPGGPARLRHRRADPRATSACTRCG